MADLRMDQAEIDDISDAFLEAWEEYFGREMYIVPFDDSATAKHAVYGESKQKKYKESSKVLVHGTFKQAPVEEYGEVAGNKNRQYASVSLVTKELRDGGITEIDQRDLLEVTDRDGNTHRFNIIAAGGKVQLVDNYIFTSLRVVRDL